MKRVLMVAVLAVAAAYAWWTTESQTRAADPQVARSAGGDAHAGDRAIAAAFQARQRGVQVRGSGVVSKTLRDDRKGEPHQRFVVRLASGQTVLIAHNIDEAPRIDALRAGDTVQFSGVYEWSAQGGVVHWTHDDPGGDHAEGWIRHDGRTYQ